MFEGWRSVLHEGQRGNIFTSYTVPPSYDQCHEIPKNVSEVYARQVSVKLVRCKKKITPIRSGIANIRRMIPHIGRFILITKRLPNQTMVFQIAPRILIGVSQLISRPMITGKKNSNQIFLNLFIYSILLPFKLSDFKAQLFGPIECV